MLRLTALALFFNLFISCLEKKTTISNHSEERPNFLVIIADDAGWNDFSFHGSEIQTPTLDSLAANGLILNRFYTYPTCSPARASFLTGRPASRMGIVAPISDKSELKLPDSITTLPQALKKLNYNTALLGKWHLGLNPENGPKAYGFDYSYGFLHGQLDQYEHRYKNGDSTWHRNGKFISEKGHVTDLLTQEAIAFISKQKPEVHFYMQVAYSAPHIPLQEPQSWLAQYENIEDPSRRAYAAAMSHMDAAIGSVLKALENKGIAENTVILFFSDNGAQENWIPNTQYDGKFEPNYTLGSNKPLRDFKTKNYEGAVRVPAIVSWPKKLPTGKIDNYISVIDWMPTFLNWVQSSTLPKTIEGEHLNDLLKSDKTRRKKPIYIRGHLQESIILQPYKLVRSRHLDAEPDFELFNLEEDPEEKINLVSIETTKFTELQNLIEMEFDKDSKDINKELPN